MHSKENFEIKLRIKDKNGKIISLKKRVDLEVNWRGTSGEVVVPKKITFKESGEEFEIIITKLKLQRGLFKKERDSYNWDVPPNASYDIYHGEPSSGSEPRRITNRDEFEDYYIKFTDPWRRDVIIIASVLLFLIIMVVIVYGWYQNKKNKFR